MSMRRTALILALALGTLLLLAGGAMADTADGDGHMGDYGDMGSSDLTLLFGPWPYFAMGFMVYWFLSLPIALLVYTDAVDRRMNGLAWLFAIAVPWVGLLVVPVYMVARRGHPRVVAHDPWAAGDRFADSARKDWDL